MSYRCTLCNYETNDSGNYSRHKKGQKHQEKVNKQHSTSIFLPNPPKSSDIIIPENSKEDGEIKCNFCNITFTRLDNLYRHQNKRCSKKNEFEKEQNLTLENKINEVKIDSILREKKFMQEQFKKLEKQLEKIEKEKEELKKEKEKEKEELKKEKEEEKKKLEDQLLYYRDVAYGNNKIENDCNMTNLNFLNKHYADAPALEGPKDLHKLFNADKSANPDVYYAQLASELGSHHRLNILHKVISEFIVKEYCKEDKSKQSVWNSDSSRLNYIIKECIQKDKIWIMDKNGKTLLDKVIKPIIDYIKVDVEEAANYIISYKKNKKLTYLDINDHKALLEIGHNIMNNTLQEDILKELTQHFNINQKLLLKDIKEKKKEIEIKAIKDKEDAKTKLLRSLQDIDARLEKIRDEEKILETNKELDDGEKCDKFDEYDENKKQLKTKKKELKKLLDEHKESEKKLNEIINEEEDISSDTESENDKEEQRQLKMLQTEKKKRVVLNKIKDIEKEITKILSDKLLTNTLKN